MCSCKKLTGVEMIDAENKVMHMRCDSCGADWRWYMLRSKAPPMPANAVSNGHLGYLVPI